MKNKPTSKVIQISSTRSRYGAIVHYHLCEDGSTWELYGREWECILEAYKEPEAKAIKTSLTSLTSLNPNLGTPLTPKEVDEKMESIKENTLDQQEQKLPEVGKTYRETTQQFSRQ